MISLFSVLKTFKYLNADLRLCFFIAIVRWIVNKICYYSHNKVLSNRLNNNSGIINLKFIDTLYDFLHNNFLFLS